jgi:hypothetical protein
MKEAEVKATGKKPARPRAERKNGQAGADGEAPAPSQTPAAPAVAASRPARSGLPPMYSAVEALSAARHGSLRLKRPDGFAHASGLSSIILGASEVPTAARDYPVVFSDRDSDSMPYAVTGYAEGVNLHVDAEGAWRKDSYVPAYVRRYPFIFIEGEGGQRLTLAIDPAAPVFSLEEGAPLYESDGKPSATAQGALAFCRAYKAEMDRTRELVRQIIQSGITVSRRADVTLPGGRRAAVGGFRIVDEALLGGLPDEEFLALRRTGALTLVYCHLMSMAAWRNLLA